MKTIVFLNLYTFAEAGMITLSQKRGFLPKNSLHYGVWAKQPGFLRQVCVTSGAVILRVNTAAGDRLYTKQKTPTP